MLGDGAGAGAPAGCRIPKANGKLRPLVISTVRDRVCMTAAMLVLEPIFEADRYCEPLRHPSAPGLSLTGVWLIIPDHASGFPVLRALSLCTCCSPLPRCSGRAYSSLKNHPSVSAFPNHYRVGLHIVLFEVCSAFTRVAACTLAQSPW